MKNINVILNGKQVLANKGETILELAKRNGYKIPTLCFDKRLKPFASCFVCVVAVENMKGYQPSCATRVEEGMIIDTEREDVKQSRKIALELILSNHYADCIAPCKQTCPANVDIQGYISLIEKGLFFDAIALIKQDNPLPAICGRVCVRPCELVCRRNLSDEKTPVGIDYLKRFVADKDLVSEQHYKPKTKKPTGKKVAIIGGGPGGLSSAYWLAQKGHKVDIFEAMKHAGGWLRYGIPEYRLPNDLIEKEIGTITELRVEIFTQKKLGENISYKEIKQEYDATILCIGSQIGTLVGVEGEDANGVFSGIDFLRNMEDTGQKYDFKNKKIIVVGGGNTAMDCCRTAIRCGSTDVTVVYRRTETEMPANKIEIHESKLEGVKYLFLTAPTKIEKNESGDLKSMVCIQMELGKPDDSGRRRPIPIKNSEFEIEADYILAAIGQKTDVNFIDDINKFSNNGELKINKWGDIEVDRKTLQTGIDNVFAAGDGVTGPATIIEAIAQAKIAANSCHQYLENEEIKPLPQDFFSKKDNFCEQKPNNYSGKYAFRKREDMPVLEPNMRQNFNEVELGYKSDIVAKNETSRCMECGCTAIHTCDLKKYATEYGAVQQNFQGDFIKHDTDFSHPFIEIDRNKCILCGRCVRICDEVVGAKALGFAKRGFDTFVAPTLDLSLKDTKCENCGLCISTCPTGSIAENKAFKILPINHKKINTICNYCSIGCTLQYSACGDFVYASEGINGLINKTGNICGFGHFGYNIINDSNRLITPKIKESNKWKNISWEDAANIIYKKIINKKPENTAFFAGARLSNEEQYFIQKITRAGVKTNNISSFHYFNQGSGYFENNTISYPIEGLQYAKEIWILGSSMFNTNHVAAYEIQTARTNNETHVVLFTESENEYMCHKADNVVLIKSKYHFVKAINYFLIKNNLDHKCFVSDHSEGFEKYKNKLLSENYENLITASGFEKNEFEKIANHYRFTLDIILVYSEVDTTPNTAIEISNLIAICGKRDEQIADVVVLKSKNNSQGLYDNGINPIFSVGGNKIENTTENMKNAWKTDTICSIHEHSIEDYFYSKKLKNILIFGEDPIGTEINSDEIKNVLESTDFLVVADYFMTATAKTASLVLPMAFPFETGGTFTNTQRIIQNFAKHINSKTTKTNIDILNLIARYFNIKPFLSNEEIFLEFISLLPKTKDLTYCFKYTKEDEFKPIFEYGADNVVLRYIEHVSELMNKNDRDV